MSLNDSTAAIIVTYNRPGDLLNCLSHIISQTYIPQIIYIIDNHSAEDTCEQLENAGYVEYGSQGCPVEGGTLFCREITVGDTPVSVRYLYKDVNDGGAGGFYAGMKLAYEQGCDWLWMMDDDGYPASDSLKLLLEMAYKHSIDYANPIVIRTDDPTRMPWKLPDGFVVSDYDNMEIYEGHVNPFNGTLVNRRVPERIGFIKREMFIWGDEVEYTCRVREAGFRIATVCQARHFHPYKPDTLTPIFPFTKRFTLQMAKKERMWLLFRNLGYIAGRYESSSKNIKTIAKFSLYFTLRLDLKGLITFYKAYRAGYRNIFE